MLQSHDILGVIPSRMASTRFPGKPLAMIGGLPMVIRVYRQASQVLPCVVIAGCDPEVEAAARQYGAAYVGTGTGHDSGTSRCLEALRIHSALTGKSFRAVINIQGDEPMVSEECLSLLKADISRAEIGISTLVRPETDPGEFSNPNRVKVVTDGNGNALYFSRSPIPYYRSGGSAWLAHIGMYAFKTEVLERIMQLPPDPLELAESLEQLRWLGHGFPVHCCPTGYRGFGIDTPEDLEKLVNSGLI